MMIVIRIAMMTMRFTHTRSTSIDARVACVTKKCTDFMIVLEEKGRSWIRRKSFHLHLQNFENEMKNKSSIVADTYPWACHNFHHASAIAFHDDHNP